METWLNNISPFVRMVKIHKSFSLAGEWMDYDHVYTYIEQGEAEFFLDGIKYQVKEGDILLMPPFMAHIIRSTSEVPLIQYIFHFDLYYDEERSSWKDQAITEERKAIANKEMQLASTIPISHLQLPDRIELKKRFLIMQKEFLDMRSGYSLILKGICLELLVLFMKGQVGHNDKEGKMTKGWVFIEKTIHLINERYGDPELDNHTISKQVGISTNHLSFLFKDQLGITIHKYLTHIRIEQSKIRMIEGNQTLTAIAEQVGFSSIYLFSRSFKATVGVMPSMFIAMNSQPTIS
ncbi:MULTISPECIES: AraC family transcriptional regulator [unclassified Paenibacillus]|uniref:AraC family transcriptional regulator n=1 Tax=unclassified Paenibacillus TaxID=185978 RepID=UPI00070E4761|nr:MULTISPECIES: AraC family transcriptional regulator [unclassified Paenibacillus]KQX45226.1 AraC family transcriptional regulator [Paenibacillus sp. Root444D2]KRE45575.1 AraC family transcriptional regulator [Paenibacillus sp. Soil724D2]